MHAANAHVCTRTRRNPSNQPRTQHCHEHLRQPRDASSTALRLALQEPFECEFTFTEDEHDAPGASGLGTCQHMYKRHVRGLLNNRLKASKTLVAGLGRSLLLKVQNAAVLMRSLMPEHMRRSLVACTADGHALPR